MVIKHLNQVELSRRWSLSPRTLERWRWLGQGPRYLKIGGRVVYRLEDIEAFEAEHMHSSASQEPDPAPHQIINSAHSLMNPASARFATGSS